jgi:glucose dehydrogenase
LLALDAETGKRKWHFQFIHHDLWDWDLPAPPVLVTIEKDGRRSMQWHKPQSMEWFGFLKENQGILFTR